MRQIFVITCLLLLLASFAFAQNPTINENVEIQGSGEVPSGGSKQFTDYFQIYFVANSMSVSKSGTDASKVDVTLDSWSQNTTTGYVATHITIGVHSDVAPGSVLHFTLQYNFNFSSGIGFYQVSWTITVTGTAGISADFEANPTSGTAPLIVQFTDKSTGTITNRTWDFGDGLTSTATNPSHTYQNVGTYTVKLTVTGTEGSNTKTRSNYISVSSSSAPFANFYGTPTSGTAPLTVQFTDQSTGNITSRLWDFGDGQTSTATNPSHTYQNAGTYTVKLTVTGAGGSNTKIRNNYIEVFTSGKNLIKNPEFDQGMNYWYTFLQHDSRYTMLIDNKFVLSGQNSLKYVIEEGGTQDWYITVFSYVPLQKDKYYEIRFKAKLEGIKTKSIKIHFQQEGEPWTVYSEKTVSLSDTTQNYGPFFLKPNVDDPNGRFNFALGLTDNIVIYFDAVLVAEYIPGPPEPEFSGTPLSGVNPLAVKFTDESTGFINSRFWDFGDGGTSRAINPSHTYQVPGIYDVSLTLLGVSGDTVNLKKDNYITVGSTNVESGNPNNKLLSSFSLEQNYPNPFNNVTKIEFEIPVKKNISLEIYDISGRLVNTLISNEEFDAGMHGIYWNGKNEKGQNVSTGVYIYRLRSGNFSVLKRMAYIR